MARQARPWFSAEKGWWMVTIRSKKVRLAKGKENKKEADRKFRELQFLRDRNPAPESGEHTVASVIELYLGHAAKRYEARSLYERTLILQSFAEAHGFRKVNDRDCLPYHLTSWLDAREQWRSDWTKNHAVAVVQRPFNWAAKQRLIQANPFRGVSHRPGPPRRPMSDIEFDLLCTTARGRETKKKPSPGERFIELLRFLRLTGARPGEAAKLRWDQVDCENAVIVLHEHKTSRTQRQPKPRTIVLTDAVVRLLVEIRHRNELGELVFRTHRGTPWNRCNLSLRVQRARATAIVARATLTAADPAGGSLLVGAPDLGAFRPSGTVFVRGEEVTYTRFSDGRFEGCVGLTAEMQAGDTLTQGIPDDVKLYGLRHAYGTRAIVSGVDIKTLAELMGHNSTRMSEHYIHLAGQRSHLHGAAEKVNQLGSPPASATPPPNGQDRGE